MTATCLGGLAETVLQILMEADVEGLIGAGRYERTGERSTYRNGYRERSLDTRLGSLNLKIPKLRTGSYFPGFLEPRKTVEKALVAVIQEAWVAGVSTRRVDDLVQAMGLSGISKSSVSKLCKEIDERVNAFLKRPLTGAWPYLWLDATYLKVREGGRIVSVAAIVAVAVNTEGRREIVGLHIGPSEAEPFWTTFLRDLVKRELSGVQLVVSDAHKGLKAAIRRVLKATWQRCRVGLLIKSMPRWRVLSRADSLPGRCRGDPHARPQGSRPGRALHHRLAAPTPAGRSHPGPRRPRARPHLAARRGRRPLLRRQRAPRHRP
jgi:transposase-like protein